jgi:cell division protein FtsA
MPVYREPIVESSIEEVAEISAKIENKKEEVQEQESTETKIKNSFFDKYVTKIKDFLDNAE